MDDFEALMSQFEETPGETPGKTPGPGETPGERTAPVAVENAVPRPVASSLLSNLKKKKEKANKRPLATMRPRVQCSECDFSGKEGAEMKEHMRRSHQIKFRCKECSFETKYNIVRRRHMMNAHQKKCERCDHVATSEDSLIAHKQADHGVLTSSMGFMLTNNDEVHNEPVATATEPDKECTDKKRKTKMEYLKEDRKVKSATKSKKDVNRSFKDQFLTQKKEHF